MKSKLNDIPPFDSCVRNLDCKGFLPWQKLHKACLIVQSDGFPWAGQKEAPDLSERLGQIIRDTDKITSLRNIATFIKQVYAKCSIFKAKKHSYHMTPEAEAELFATLSKVSPPFTPEEVVQLEVKLRAAIPDELKFWLVNISRDLMCCQKHHDCNIIADQKLMLGADLLGNPIVIDFSEGLPFITTLNMENLLKANRDIHKHFYSKLLGWLTVEAVNLRREKMVELAGGKKEYAMEIEKLRIERKKEKLAKAADNVDVGKLAQDVMQLKMMVSQLRIENVILIRVLKQLDIDVDALKRNVPEDDQSVASQEEDSSE